MWIVLDIVMNRTINEGSGSFRVPSFCDLVSTAVCDRHETIGLVVSTLYASKRVDVVPQCILSDQIKAFVKKTQRMLKAQYCMFWQTQSQNANPYTHVTNAANVPSFSSIQSMDIMDENGTIIAVPSATVPIVITIPRSSSNMDVTGKPLTSPVSGRDVTDKRHGRHR